ncbi:hypothetical protein HBA94_16495 [Ochrobactrum sp. GRS2]|nr:hypothetical protein [Ochrobactrum sp. GRS2]
MVEFYGASIFCEDVRIEASGQRTYVGVFPRRIVIDDELPFTVPPICVVSHISASIHKSGLRPKFVVTLKAQSGKEITVLENELPELPFVPDKKKNIVHAVFNTYLDDLEIEETSLITTSVVIEDDNFITGNCIISPPPNDDSDEKADG